MEPPSCPAPRGLVPLQGLLLAVSLLTFWNPPTTAQLILELEPLNAAEGKDVLFHVHNLPEDVTGYAWHKGERVDSTHRIATYRIDTQVSKNGPAHSGRETIYHNGSLLFQNVTLEDTGYYTLQVITAEFQHEEATGQLRVYLTVLKPSIATNNSNPMEHKDPVVLTCEPETQNTTYLWLIKSQTIQNSSKLELSNNNRTLTLFNVTRNDTGPYECETRNPVSTGHSDPLSLNVLYGPEAPTISPSDTHHRSGANLSLSCHADSNPPAQYSWLINGRPKQSTQKLFIPNITANDSGCYTCLVHNSVTGLIRTTVRTIMVSAEENSSGHPGWTIAGVIGVMVGVVLVATLGCFLFLRTRRASDRYDLRERRPPASTPGHHLSSSSSSPVPMLNPRTAFSIYEELLTSNTDIYCRIDTKAEVAS